MIRGLEKVSCQGRIKRVGVFSLESEKHVQACCDVAKGKGLWGEDKQLCYTKASEGWI